jgi:hypothetical protein
MIKKNGKWVVGVGFNSQKDAELFEELLAHRGRVAVVPHEFEAQFVELNEPITVTNTNTGDVNGALAQFGHVGGSINIAGKRVQD